MNEDNSERVHGGLTRKADRTIQVFRSAYRGTIAGRISSRLLSAYYVDDADVVVERSSDGGATFSSLAANNFNFTGVAEMASLGAGRRVFQ